MNSIHDFETKEKAEAEQQTKKCIVKKNATLADEANSEAIKSASEALTLAHTISAAFDEALPNDQIGIIESYLTYTDEDLPRFPKLDLPKGKAAELETLTKTIKDLEKTIHGIPIISRFREELTKLEADPEYKNADLNRLEFDYKDEEKTIFANTLHNRALQLAIDRAGTGLPADMIPSNIVSINALRAEAKIKDLKVITSFFANVLTSKGIINSNVPYEHHPITRGPAKEITTTLLATIPDNAELKNIPYPAITVLGGFMTYGHYKQWIFKKRDLYRKIATLSKDDKLSPKTDAEIDKAIEILEKTKIKLDATDELKEIARRTGKTFDKLIFEGYLINLSVVYEDGEEYYMLQGKPLLLDYLEFTNGLTTINKDTLKIYADISTVGADPDTGKPVYQFSNPLPLSWERIQLRNKLYVRLGQMLDEKGYLRDRQSKYIRFEPILNAIVKAKTRKNLTEHKKFLIQVIKNFEARGVTHGCGWEPYYEGKGKELVGVKILAKEKPVKEKSIFPKKVAEE